MQPNCFGYLVSDILATGLCHSLYPLSLPSVRTRAHGYKEMQRAREIRADQAELYVLHLTGIEKMKVQKRATRMV